MSEIECPLCHGEGQVRMGGESLNPSSGVRGPDPQCDYEARCPRCGGSGEVPASQIGWNQADEDHAVVTVKGGHGFRARPCRECPWRRENVGGFPTEAFRHSATTAYDMADRTFGCHTAGTAKPTTCAGALLSTGAEHNLSVRMRILNDGFRWEQVTTAGADLFDSYREMAEANGVDPEDPVLAPCR